MTSLTPIASPSVSTPIMSLLNSFYDKVKGGISPSLAWKIALCIELGLFIPTLYSKYFRKQPKTNEDILQQIPTVTREEIQKQLRTDKAKPPNVWNGVAIFFPDPHTNSAISSANQFLWFFEQAEFRIQLCIYLSSYAPLENIILRKRNKGVLIQVITDYDTCTSHNNFNIERWKHKGIQVKLRANGYLMHNKFAIIDEQAVLTGSLNWTKQGMTLNRENILVSTDVRIVDKYIKEYDKLWALCEKADACADKYI